MNGINIIEKRKIFLSVAALFVFASIVSIFSFGFKQGIDFVGGSLWHVKFAESAEIDETVLRENLASAGIVEVIVTREFDFGGFIVKMREISEEEHQIALASLREKFGEVKELRFEVIGPTIGRELRRNSLTAFALVIVSIALFVAFSFRKVSHPVASWKYGVVALATLFHDAIIPAGLFALLGYSYGVEIDTNFIIALLVIMAYSINDTIVVFDRIRENLLLSRRDADFSLVVNNSVNQTFARSINTSLTLIFILFAFYFLGPASLQNFILALLVGIIFGTYSSIFVASPLLVVWHNFGKR